MGFFTRLLGTSAPPLQTRDPFDNPNIPLSQALAMGWATPSPTGFPVSATTVLGIPSLKRAVQLISGHIARLDIVGYRIGRNGSRIAATDHPAWNLLHWRPSPLYSSVDWKQAVMVDVLLRGNHFSWIIRDPFGKPQELIRLDPDQVQVMVYQDTVRYQVMMADGSKKYATDSDMLHFKSMGNGIVGNSVVDTMLDALGLAGAIQRYSAIYFSNNCAPGILLEYAAPPAQGKESKEKLIANLEQMHMGLEKSHRVAVLPYGLKIVNYQIDAEKAQLLQSRQFTLIDVSNAIGISAQKLGAQISTNYGSLEAENRAFLEDLEIYLCSIAEEINYKLLTEDEKRLGRLYYDFDRSSMQKSDPKTDNDIWIARVNNGLSTLNEYRTATDQETIEGDFADLHRMPANIVYAETAAEPTPSPVVPQLDLGTPVPVVPPVEPEDGPEGTGDRLRTLIGVDVDRQIVRLQKASEGKSESWFAGEDFLPHREVFVRSLPWGTEAIDGFLEGVIAARRIDQGDVEKLKGELCRS